MDEKKEYFKCKDTENFNERNKRKIKEMGQDENFRELSKQWGVKSLDYEYTHHFRWLGRPIIQLPQDIMAMQEIIWKVKPEIIIETGIARGGSLVFHASMLKLLENNGKVIGIDIALRKHNRDAIEKHPLCKNVKIIDGSSVDQKIVDKVYGYAKGKKALVILDSNHSHEHALKELNLYSPLVKKDSYLIVLDTWLEDFPKGYFQNRPWDKGNNSATAVEEFLKTNKRFVNDKEMVDKLMITCSPTGYLKCIRD